MSRSNNTELINPAIRFYDWMGSKGCLKYFDKTRGEKGENVEVQLPFTFLVLDRLATIKGFSDADQSGFWSNEVRNTKTEKFIVRTKKGIVYEGLYGDMAAILNAGASYCQSVYIAFYDENKQLQLGNFQIQGSAIGSWITFCKGKNIFKDAIEIYGKEAKKKGATNYFEPQYKTRPVSEETDKKAIELDKLLQEYLTAYFKRNATPESEKEPTTRSEANAASFDAQKPVVHTTPVEDTSTVIYEPADIVDPMDDLPF